MATASSTRRCARFDQFEVDFNIGELRKSGQRIALQDQPFHILRILLESAPEVVTREQISAVLWPSNTFVDFDLAINTAIRKLRQALEDSADQPKFIQTLAKRGYRFIPKLEWANDAPEFVPSEPSAEERGRPRLRCQLRTVLQILLFCFALAIVSWSLWKFWPRKESVAESPFAAVPLTALPGNAQRPSFSPDGQQIVFSWDKNQGWPRRELFVQSIGGSGPPLQLTHTAAPAALASALSAWSPDGKWIAYQRFNPKPGLKPIEIVLIPAPTGGPEIVLQRINVGQCGLSWSPDGKYLAFTDRDVPEEPYALFLLQRDTLERRQLTTPPKGILGGDAYGVFSGDGKRVAFVRDLDGVSQVAVLTLASGGVRTVISERGLIGPLAWDPSNKDIIYGSNIAGFWRLWRVSSEGGSPRSLGTGEDAVAPAVSERTHRLAYGRGTIDSNIWQVQVGKDGREARTPLIASSRQDYQPSFSPDETKVVFTSDRSGPNEIWLTNRDGSNPMQITRLGNPTTGNPRWSPNGKQIAFDSRVSGHAAIYVIGLDGTSPRRVTNDGFDDFVPSWSGNGKWVYYQSNRTGRLQIWKIPVDGGEPVQVTKQGGQVGFESSDRKTLYYISTTKDGELWQMSLPSGNDYRVSSAPDIPDSMSYQLTNEGIYFAVRDSSGSDMHSSLRYFSFANGKTRTVTPLGNMTWTQGISVSKNGRTVLYAQQDHLDMNIMLVENFH